MSSNGENKENHSELKFAPPDELVKVEKELRALPLKNLRNVMKRNHIYNLHKKDFLVDLLMEKLYKVEMEEYSQSAGEFAQALEGFNKTSNHEFPFAIKKFTPVATWSYNVDNSICSICRLDFTELCISCVVKEEKLKATRCKDKQPINCKIESSIYCNHVFHECCISSWTEKSPKCPLCQKAWTKGYYFENEQ